MYVHSAGSILRNSISATAYVQRSAIEYIQGIKAAALLFVASVSKQKPSAHFIAMAEMVVHSVYILELLLRHQVLSISNEIQDQFYLSQVPIKTTVERIHKEMLARILIPHLRRTLPMIAVI
jgi:hypothetical protein